MEGVTEAGWGHNCVGVGCGEDGNFSVAKGNYIGDRRWETEGSC